MELAEKYPELPEKFSEYQKAITSTEIHKTMMAASQISEILSCQYSKEVEQWKSREILGKIVKGTLDYGASMIVWPTVLLSNLTLEWKSIIVLIEVVKRTLYRKVAKLDTKKIVEKLWRVENWPLVEKGIPYMLWKTET